MRKKPTNNLNKIWEFPPKETQYWVKRIQDDLNSSEFKRPNNKDEAEHFENGHYLHSSQYFFAKKYFQSSNNCDKMVILLVQKIKELDLKDTTLIGFRSYIGMLLSKAQSLLSECEFAIDYAIVEQKKETEFTWQFIPDFSKIKKNLVIVLPITCTCSTYIRLRKYIELQVVKLKKKFSKSDSTFDTNWRVDDRFINIFLIQEETILSLERPVVVDREKLRKIAINENRKLTEIENNLSNLYTDYNWERIEKNSIYFTKHTYRSTKKRTYYIAHPLVNLYSKLYLPENCPLCFPEKGSLSSERNIFPTHNNFETPNLLIGFPNFATKAITHSQNSGKKFLFNKLFASSESLGSSHLYGHIRVNENSYLNYIRGNTFYQHNSADIINFFNIELGRILLQKDEKKTKIQDIVFITSEGKHNSAFLDEIASSKILSTKKPDGNYKFKVHILRFDASNEFVDNFMSNYKALIRDSNSILTIYFEEVISAGITFKLVSDYLKHYKHQTNPKRQNRHGFDYIFTLIDRTPFYTREEMIKKLFSTEIKNAEKNFISYFKLNVPIIAAAHLGNPLIENVVHLKKMLLESHLDALKAKIASEFPSRIANELPEENILINKFTRLKYFPFENEWEDISKIYFDTYKAIITNGKLDLLKLYVAHQINSILSDQSISSEQFKNLRKNQAEGKLIEYIVEEIWRNILEEEELFFTNEKNVQNRNLEIELEIVHDTIIKILSRHPFTYYKDIYDAIFKYCLTQMDLHRKEIENLKGKISFALLRRFKLYIRRLIDLDSSYLISNDFIMLLKLLFEHEQWVKGVGVNSLRNELENKIDKLVDEYSDNDVIIQNLNNLAYKFNQVNSFFLFLIYSFKECVFKNHYRSIRLEHLLNSRDLLPANIYSEDNTVDSTLRLIKDPYYQITGIIKAENIYLLNQLKNLHKKTYLNSKRKERNLKADPKLSKEVLNALLEKIKKDFPFDKPKSISEYYFNNTRNDPVIINANKFISNSRYALEQSDYFEHIKLAIAEMLKSATLLMNESSLDNEGFFLNENETNEHDFVVEIRSTIQSVVKILQHGIEPAIIIENGKEVPLLPGSKESKLKYALCFEYIESIPSNDNESNNVFVISSEDSDTGAKLDTGGLIYNLLYGLHSSIEIFNEAEEKTISEEGVEYENKSRGENIHKHKVGLQSLLVSINTGEKFTSFSDDYLPYNFTNKNKFQTFDDLYRKDRKYNSFGTGLSILNSAPMALFFRLSDVDLISLNEDKVNLKGKAVLVVTFEGEPIKSNYLSFMSNEKVRLLLLVKEDLIQYLQRRFASGAFAELLRNKEQNKQLAEYQKHLKHGIGSYTSYQIQIVEEYENIRSKIDTIDNADNFEYEFDKKIIANTSFAYKEFILINKSISSQTGLFTKKDGSMRTFFHEYFIDIINTIYFSKRLGEFIGELNYEESIEFLNKKPFNNIRIPYVVLYCIIPEIILNQKKYGVERKITWNETESFLELLFENKLTGTNSNDGYGLKMCKEIKNLYNNSIIIDVPDKPYTDTFMIKLKIIKNEKNSNY